MHMIALCSKNFRGVGYDADAELMHVVGRDDQTRIYETPLAVYHSIIASPTKSIAERLDEETALRRPVRVEELKV